LWLGQVGQRYATVVSLGGIRDVSALQQLAKVMPSARLIDRVAGTTEILSTYRQALSGLLALIYAIAGIILIVRFGFRAAPRILLPSIRNGDARSVRLVRRADQSSRCWRRGCPRPRYRLRDFHDDLDNRPTAILSAARQRTTLLALVAGISLAIHSLWIDCAQCAVMVVRSVCCSMLCLTH
jgi:hypothetical protein